MAQQGEFEKFLEEEKRKRGETTSAPTPDLDSEFEAFMRENQGGQSSSTPSPSPTPSPQPQRPAYIPVTQRQEFGKTLPDINTALTRSNRSWQGQMARESTELQERSKGIRIDRSKPVNLEESNRRLRSVVSDPVKMALLPPEQRDMLGGGAAQLEQKRQAIEPRQQVQPRPEFMKERKVDPRRKLIVDAVSQPFDSSRADRAILDAASDPAAAANFTEQEWQDLQGAAQGVRRGVRAEQAGRRLDELVAQGEAEKAALSTIEPTIPERVASRLTQAALLLPSEDEAHLRQNVVETVDRFMRGAVGTGASELRGLTLLDPNMESDPQLQAFAPENVQDLTRRALPVDPTNQGLLAKGVEAAGSAVPFALGSVAGGAAGLPSWFAPMVLGAASNAGQTYDEAIAAGQNSEQAKRAAIAGALIGMTEAVGVGRFGGKAPGLLRSGMLGGLRELGRAGAENFGEEFLQEGFSRVLNNVNAKIVSGYDPKRAIAEGFAEDAFLGGLVGLGFGGGTHLAGMTAGAVGARIERSQLAKRAAEAVRTEHTRDVPARLEIARMGMGLPDQAKQTQVTPIVPVSPINAPAQDRLPVAKSRQKAKAEPNAAAPAQSDQPQGELSIRDQILQGLQPLTKPQGQGQQQQQPQGIKVYQPGETPATPDRGRALTTFKDDAGNEIFIEHGSNISRRAAVAMAKQQASAQQPAQTQQPQQPAQTPAPQAPQPAQNPALEYDRAGAIDVAKKEGWIAPALLQRRLKIGYGRASAVMDRLKQEGWRQDGGRLYRPEPTEPIGTEGIPQAQPEPQPSPEAQQRNRAVRAAMEIGDQAEQDANTAIDEGRFDDARDALKRQKDAIQELRRQISADKRPGAVKLRDKLGQQMRQIDNRLGTIRQQARDAAKESKKQENARTSGIATPLLDQAAGATGATRVNLPIAQGRSAISEALARQQRQGPAQGEAQDNVRIISRIRQLGGIDPAGVYTGELQSAVDKRYPGLINRQGGVKPDTLIEYLAEEGYPVDREDLNTLFAAIDDDVAGKMVYPMTRSRTAELDQEFEEYQARQQEEFENAETSGLPARPEEGAEWPRQPRPSSRRPVPRATDESVEQLRARQADLEEFAHYEGAELSDNLADELRELRSVLWAYEDAKLTPGQRRERDARRLADVQYARRLSPEEYREYRAALDRIETQINAELDAEIAAAEPDEAALIERAVAAIDQMFEDEETLEFLDQTIADPSFDNDFIFAVERVYGVQEDAARSIIESQRAARDREISRSREKAAEIASKTRSPELGEERGSEETPRQFTKQDASLLNIDPSGVSDASFDPYVKSLEKIRNDNIRGLLDWPEAAIRHVQARLKQTQDERSKRVDAGRLPALHPSRGSKLPKDWKKIYGQRLVEQMGQKQAPQAEVGDAIGEAVEKTEAAGPDIGADLVRGMQKIMYSPTSPVEVAELRKEFPNLSKDQFDAEMLKLVEEGRIFLHRHDYASSLSEADRNALVKVKDPLGRGYDGNSYFIAATIPEGAAPESQTEAPAQEARTVTHSNPAIDRKPVLAETSDGRVVVPNPENKSGVSVVKDRSDEPAEHKFSSTQVNLPPEIADQIIEFGKRIPDAALTEDGRETESHITLKYGLHGWDPQFVKDALAGEGPITVTFGKVSLFENETDVVKVDVESPDLYRLNEKIAKSQPNTESHPEYKPHVTIAYVKKGRGKRYVGNTFLEGKTITLDSVTFSGRDGERVEIPLGGAQKKGTAELEGIFDDEFDKLFGEEESEERPARPKLKFDKISPEAREQAVRFASRWGDVANDQTAFTELVENSRVRYRRDPQNPRAGIIYIDSHAHRLYVLMLSEYNERDESFVAMAVHGDNLDAHRQMVRYFKDVSRNVPAAEWAVSEFEHALSYAIADRVDGVVFFDVHLPTEHWDLATTHESFHVWQYGAPATSGGWVERQPGHDKMRAELIARNYRDDPESTAREWAAYAVTNDLERFGFTEEEGLQFLDAYFDEIVNQGGADALDRIGNVAPKPREIIERKQRQYGNQARSETTEEPGGQEGGNRGSGTQTDPETSKIAAGRSPAGSRISLQGRTESGREGGGRTQDEREAQPTESSGGTYLGAGLGSLQALFDRPKKPKTTPNRAIADWAGHAAMRVDPESIRKETLKTLTEALARGKAGSLPFARATYWAEKLGSKRLAGAFGRKQKQFLDKANTLVQEITTASKDMDNAKRGSVEWEKARRRIERARVKLSNHLSKATEYTHPVEYVGKLYRASLLSAPHIHKFNMLAQAWQFPLHEAQKSIDFLVPSKLFQKMGIPYDKPPADIRDWAPAIAREFKAILSGAGSSFGDVIDMFRYGVTETQLAGEMAQDIQQKRRRSKEPEKAAGGTDKFELGNRPRLIPGLDQAIMMVGRSHGAADVPFYNIVFATALAAEADATAKKMARDNPQLNLTREKIEEIARDLAHEPSPAMVEVARDEASRFKLDYETWGYKVIEAIRNVPMDQYAGRTADALYKTALKAVFTFTKIPTAAVDTALFRYSPVGFARVGSRLAVARSKKAKKEQFKGIHPTADAFARDTAELYRQAIVGTLSWATVGILGSLGYMAFTGGGDDDDRQNIAATREALGERYTPEAIVGDTAYDLQKLGPVGQAAAVGARVIAARQPRYDKKTQETEPNLKRWDRAISTGLRAVATSAPLGRGVEDIGEALSSSSIGGGAGKFVAGKGRAVVPGLFRDVAKMMSPTKVIPDDNSAFGRLRGDLQSGIPGQREKMQPRLDALGRPVEEPNPFTFTRSVKRDPQIEEVRDLDVGLTKPQREKGEAAADYNKRVQGRGEQFQKTLGQLREGKTMPGASTSAKRAVYERALQSKQMDRADKLSPESVETERAIEALRGNTFEALRSMPEYQGLSEKDKEAVRKMVDEELKLFRAEASHVRKGTYGDTTVAEKMAIKPVWTPEDLAKAVLEARQ